MRAVTVVCSIVLFSVLVGRVGAQVPLVSYDNFNSFLIDPAKWIGSEPVDPALPPPQGAAEVFRGILFGQLNMLHRIYGNPAAENFNRHDLRLNFRDPAPITAMQAKITPLAYELKGCPTNPGDAVRMRIQGAFFNAGTPTPGDFTDDVFARAEIIRSTSFPEPANIFRVRARVSRCINATCSELEIMNADMGTLALRQSTTVRVRWDKLGKRFIFKRDTNPEITIAYTWADDAEPANPGKNLALDSFAPNCGATRTVAFIHAAFDDVFVNP